MQRKGLKSPEGLGIYQWWCLAFYKNEKAWRDKKYKELRDDIRLTEDFLKAFPQRLYMDRAYQVQEYRLDYNEGHLTKGKRPEWLSRPYNRRRFGGRVTLWVRGISGIEVQENNAGVSIKGKVEKRKRRRRRLYLKEFVANLFRQNSNAKVADRLTDLQLIKAIREKFPRHKSWRQTDRLALITLKGYRRLWNNGFLSDKRNVKGALPTIRSVPYDENGKEIPVRLAGRPLLFSADEEDATMTQP